MEKEEWNTRKNGVERRSVVGLRAKYFVYEIEYDNRFKHSRPFSADYINITID